MSNGCCGMCLMGPFGLLCGLCGTGTKVDINNEVMWICKSCGKEHLSQKDALQKAQAESAGTALILVAIAIALSAWHTMGNLHWIFLAFWALTPIGGWIGIQEEISKELGYPLEEIIPADTSPYVFLAVAEIAMILALIFGGGIINNILA